MKKAMLLSAGLAVVAAAPALADFPGAGTGGAIPDNNNVGITSTIVLTAGPNEVIDDLNVNVGLLRHSWIGDLRMTLTHVGFGSVTFLNRVGVGVPSGGSDPGTDTVGDSANFGVTLTTGANYTFDDEGADLLALVLPNTSTNQFVPSGSYSHVNAADLSAFDGQPVAGTWTLTISDHAGLDTGRFENWDLKILSHEVPAPGALALLGLAGVAGLRRRRH